MITCTFPGRYGDLLWALPTCRAIAEATPEGQIDLVISPTYGSIASLLVAQPYLHRVTIDPDWQVQETAPMTPRESPNYPDAIHLGYQGWPSRPLPIAIYDQARSQSPIPTGFLPLDLDRPWITWPADRADRSHRRVWVGWSEEWFELKVGLLALIAARFSDVEFWWLRPWGGRYDAIDHAESVQRPDRLWTHVGRLGSNVTLIRCDWRGLAGLAQACDVYLGCLSAPWVLANALGISTVVVEPAEARQHPIFWCDRPRNRLVHGGDGRPTFDARHAGDVLAALLEEGRDDA